MSIQRGEVATLHLNRYGSLPNRHSHSTHPCTLRNIRNDFAQCGSSPCFDHPTLAITVDETPPGMNGHERLEKQALRIWDRPGRRISRTTRIVAKSETRLEAMNREINRLKQIGHFLQQLRAYRRVNPTKQEKIVPILLLLWKDISDDHLEGVDPASQTLVQEARPLMESLKVMARAASRDSSAADEICDDSEKSPPDSSG